MKDDPYEIKTSQYSDPDQKSGQHTNGPANIFVRVDDSSPWYMVDGIKSTHKVRTMVQSMGFERFLAMHCTKVADQDVKTAGERA